MYVEDAIQLIGKILTDIHAPFSAYVRVNNAWASTVFPDYYAALTSGKELTNRQGAAFVRNLAGMRRGVIEHGVMTEEQFDEVVKRPAYRKKPRETIYIPSEVRYLGDNVLGFRFKYTKAIYEDLKQFGGETKATEQLESDLKTVTDIATDILQMRVTRDNIRPIMKFIRENAFKFDDDVAEFLLLCENSHRQASTFVLHEESSQIIANVCDNEILASWVKYTIYGELA